MGRFFRRFMLRHTLLWIFCFWTIVLRCLTSHMVKEIFVVASVQILVIVMFSSSDTWCKEICKLLTCRSRLRCGTCFQVPFTACNFYLAFFVEKILSRLPQGQDSQCSFIHLLTRQMLLRSGLTACCCILFHCYNITTLTRRTFWLQCQAKFDASTFFPYVWFFGEAANFSILKFFLLLLILDSSMCHT